MIVIFLQVYLKCTFSISTICRESMITSGLRDKMQNIRKNAHLCVLQDRGQKRKQYGRSR